MQVDVWQDDVGELHFVTTGTQVVNDWIFLGVADFGFRSDA